MNLVQATLRRRNGSLRLEFGEHELALQDAVLNKHRALNDFVDRSVILGVRPESMQDAVLENGVDESQRLRVTVDLREALGSDVLIHFRLAAPPVLTEDTRELARDTDPGLNEAHGAPTTIFVARVSPSSRLREGSSGELVIDQRALHFFEPETGASIAGEL
jgi:multiple sugar transport system ATP-binding protein